ncbi:MAG: hypothetical protein NVV66_18120 [Cellulomonas sp.]|uniref:hypothetical protein n=1 Tax=Cellulomonas sp. TaxID=40001 RepID=UPI002582FC0A|nr:hypothetical protein [Cellulomonas sp.]MCR6706513.1 hypothetical protein [Cellulomonas sp.]
MTSFTLTRGDARALLLATAPHAGRDTDDTPQLGRVRFVPTGDAVLAWCTDYATSVVARALVDHDHDDVTAFDLPIAEVRAALAVFKPPAGDARMHWLDELMRVEVTSEHVVLTELGQLLDGRQLKVSRIVPANDADRYPDVPRLVADSLTGVPTTGNAYRVKAEHVARFTAIAAWHGTPVRLHGVDDPSSVLVRIGTAVLGLVPAYPVSADHRDTERQDLGAWRSDLEPLRRPERVEVSEAVTEALRDQAAEIFRGKGVTVVNLSDLERLRVVEGTDQRDDDLDGQGQS